MESLPSKESPLKDDQTLPIVRNAWKEIDDEFNSKRNEISKYRESKSKECQIPINPTVQYLNAEVFELLLPTLEQTISKAVVTGAVNHKKSTFSGIDFVSEMLWNLNPRHPNRRTQWKYIFDVDWVVDYLKDKPRPYFPFSWIWSREYAATKIQAYMRGYWARTRVNVQELRQFWKCLHTRSSHNLMPSASTAITDPEVKVIYIK